VLLVALFVMTLDYLVMAVAGTIWLLLAGRIVGGITAATQSTAAAYMADISKPHEKAANFGLLGAALGVGFVFGPLMGGLLAEFGTRAPFYAAAALAAANMTFGYFALPETVTDAIRRPFRWRRANPLGALAHIGSLPGVGKLLIVWLIYGVASFVYPAIWAYFGQARFGWGPGMIGLSLAAFGISVAIVQGALMRPILMRIGERNAVLLGLTIDFVAFTALAFVSNGILALLLTPVIALGSIAGPAMQGIMSRTASDAQQGELQGALTSIHAVAMIIAPLVMTQTFWFFTSTRAPFFLPSAPFLLSGMLTLLCVAVVLSMRPARAST
jgi:DHA1 family tetracycline resistance protein-like MFS transporter